MHHYHLKHTLIISKTEKHKLSVTNVNILPCVINISTEAPLLYDNIVIVHSPATNGPSFLGLKYSKWRP